MPRTGAQNRGIQRERDLKRRLETDGWFVVRASGSLGDADLLAAKQGEPLRLVEVKSTTRGPFSGFPPADRLAVLRAAEVAGAEAWLVWWPSRAQPEWIPSALWPVARTEEAA